jgi:hypothetical protein
MSGSGGQVGGVRGRHGGVAGDESGTAAEAQWFVGGREGDPRAVCWSPRPTCAHCHGSSIGSLLVSPRGAGHGRPHRLGEAHCLASWPSHEPGSTPAGSRGVQWGCRDERPDRDVGWLTPPMVSSSLRPSFRPTLFTPPLVMFDLLWTGLIRGSRPDSAARADTSTPRPRTSCTRPTTRTTTSGCTRAFAARSRVSGAAGGSASSRCAVRLKCCVLCIMVASVPWSGEYGAGLLLERVRTWK